MSRMRVSQQYRIVSHLCTATSHYCTSPLDCNSSGSCPSDRSQSHGLTSTSKNSIVSTWTPVPSYTFGYGGGGLPNLNVPSYDLQQRYRAPLLGQSFYRYYRANALRVRPYTRLSPSEVTSILRAHENSEEVNLGSIKSFDTNQLPSNNPIEDTRSEARCLLTTGMLFGVFDGHGGPSCSQVISKRLLNYVAASLLPSDVLHQLLNPNLSDNNEPGSNSDLPFESFKILETYNDRFDLVQDLQRLYNKSFQHLLHHFASKEEPEPFSMSEALERAFIRLDDDISCEARIEQSAYLRSKENSASPRPAPTEGLAKKTLSVALSGAVAAVAHVDGEHLHVASCGDCQAVLGVRTNVDDTDHSASIWTALPLTKEHNSHNDEEVARILSEHPESERDQVIINDRLLGQLAPLRAFGDVRFKWTKETIAEYLVPYMGRQATFNQSQTPPYLTASPEVTYHRLGPKDSFLIIASDGLWDMLSPSQAVRLVGEHMSGKTVLSPYSLPKKEEIRLGSLHETLSRRVEAFKLKPIDSNAATHLIRHALGGTDYGLDHNRLSYFLTIPQDTVRLFRDDITATVIFFDSDYLSQRPLLF